MHPKERDGATPTRALAAAVAPARGRVTGPVVFAFVALTALAATGCSGTTIQPGHRGLLFTPDAGLHHEVLHPGFHRTPGSARIDDFTVTYTSHSETLSALSSEGLRVDVRFSVMERPIISELYLLDTEGGAGYYQTIVAPEARAAWVAAIGSRSYREVPASKSLEDAVEANLRERVRGKHIEISAVRLETVTLDPAVDAALRDHALRDERARARAAMEAHAASLSSGAKVPPERNLTSPSDSPGAPSD